MFTENFPWFLKSDWAKAEYLREEQERSACPVRGKRQKVNRDACYSCQTPFQYEA